MIEINVSDMSCGHCVSAITRAVKEVDAAGRCEVDLAGKKVRIESGHDAVEFLDAIRAAGYTPAQAA